MLSQFIVKGRGESVCLHIKVDVTSGDLPFLVGLESLDAMAATFNFTSNNLPLAVHNSILVFDLIYHSLHLRLPFQATSNYYCTLLQKQS